MYHLSQSCWDQHINRIKFYLQTSIESRIIPSVIKCRIGDFGYVSACWTFISVVLFENQQELEYAITLLAHQDEGRTYLAIPMLGLDSETRYYILSSPDVK